MRSKIHSRMASGFAVVLLSILVGASGAFAGSANDGANHAQSGEHRNDAAAHADHGPAPAPTAALAEPQPASTADFSGNGANVHGAYDSTRDGSASLTGNGAGAAVGKPCAGCVGKADNKNPSGQFPNGRLDPNNGYECDGNSGVGKTNPAHTGCVVAPIKPPTVPVTKPAQATVLGESFTAPSPASVLPLTATAPQTQTLGALARTGSSGLPLLALIGLGLLVIGAIPALYRVR